MDYIRQRKTPHNKHTKKAPKQDNTPDKQINQTSKKMRVINNGHQTFDGSTCDRVAQLVERRTQEP